MYSYGVPLRPSTKAWCIYLRPPFTSTGWLYHRNDSKRTRCEVCRHVHCRIRFYCPNITYLFLGIYPGFPNVVSWLANNLAGDYKRATGMAMQMFVYSFSQESLLTLIVELVISAVRSPAIFGEIRQNIISATASRSCLYALDFSQLPLCG